MWYSNILLKFAGTKEDYLQTLNLDNNVINFIVSQDEKTSNFLINNIRNNNSLTIPELQQLVNNFQQKQQKYQPTRLEQTIMSQFRNVDVFYRWGLDQLRKHRIISNNEINYDINLQGITDTFNFIYDWYRVNDIPIFDYTLETANEKQEIWHAAKRGESDMEYSPTEPQNIVYGPKWQNPEFEGWTIQAVTRENDLICEHNKMNHCVDTYANEVKQGRVRVFSLRDPKNQPHATVGLMGDSNNAFQIYGHSNSELKPKYKEMIREWFLSLGDVGNNSNINDDEDEDYEDSEEIIAYLEKQLSLIGKDYDDYGMLKEDNEIRTAFMYTNIKSVLQNFTREYYNEYTYDRDTASDLPAIIENLLKLSYAITLKQYEEYLNAPTAKPRFDMNSLVNACQHDLEEANSNFDSYYDNYDYYYNATDEDLSEEERNELVEQQISEEYDEFMSNGAQASFPYNLIETLYKTPEMLDLFNKTTEIMKQAKDAENTQ